MLQIGLKSGQNFLPENQTINHHLRAGQLQIRHHVQILVIIFSEIKSQIYSVIEKNTFKYYIQVIMLLQSQMIMCHN